jgi:hypothetical protein
MHVSKRIIAASLVLGIAYVAFAALYIGAGGFTVEAAHHATSEKGGDFSHNFPENAFEYAKLVEPQLGVPPKIDLAEGVEISLYVDGVMTRGNLRNDCENPSRLGKGCISGSVLQRYEGQTADGEPLPDVVWVSFGRNASITRRGTTYVNGSVQMIGYDQETGATAFFESSDKIDPWADVDPDTGRLIGAMPWIDDPEEFNKAFRTPRSIQCVECHQNDPFIHNDFIDSAKLPGTNETVVPQIAGKGRSMQFDLPYSVIGGENWDMRTIHIEGNKCLDCHRVGMGTTKLFMRYDWDPNEHMPPLNPGSLSEDFQALLDCWENTPENTPGCDWVIPPTEHAVGRIVGDDYPYKAAFNTPGREALSIPGGGHKSFSKSKGSGKAKGSSKAKNAAKGKDDAIFGDMSKEELLEEMKKKGMTDAEITDWFDALSSKDD